MKRAILLKALLAIGVVTLAFWVSRAGSQVPTNPPYSPTVLNQQLGQTIFTNGQNKITAATMAPFISNIIGSYCPLTSVANLGNPSQFVYGFGPLCQPLIMTPQITAGINTIIFGSWPNITISSVGPVPGAGGAANQIQWNNTGGLDGFTMNGDCLLAVPSGTITCTKTNGTLFTALATLTPGTGVAVALANNTNAAGGFPTVPVPNADLANASTTVAGQVCALGGSCSIAYSNLSAGAPTATSSVLGLVKPDGTTITNAAGAISVAYGTGASTAAQGNDSRITGALQTSALGANVQTGLGVAANAAGGVLLGPVSNCNGANNALVYTVGSAPGCATFAYVGSVSGGFGTTVTGTATAPVVNYDPTQIGWATRNRLYNSGMAIDQYGAGAQYTIAIASGVSNYTVDGWYCYESAAGANLTAQQQSVKSGGVNYALQITRTAANTNGTSCFQPIESNNMIDLQGKAVTFSIRAKVGATWSGSTPTISIISGTNADEGSASLAANTWTGQTTCGSATPTLTTSFAFYVVTCTVAAGAKELAVKMSWTWSGTTYTNDWIQFTDAELVPGTYTAAQIVPERPSIDRQIVACQRYYATSYNLGTAVGAVTHVGMLGSAYNYYGQNVSFPVAMRVSPTVNYWDGAGNQNKTSQIPNTLVWVDNSTPTNGPFNIGTTGFVWEGASYAGTTFIHYTANARL
jgi:hypothetical protein